MGRATEVFDYLHRKPPIPRETRDKLYHWLTPDDELAALKRQLRWYRDLTRR